MSDPRTRAILGIYLVTCLIVYQRETAIAAPSEEIINGIAYLCCRPTSAACQSTKALVRIAAWMLLVLLPIARVAIIWFFCSTL